MEFLRSPAGSKEYDLLFVGNGADTGDIRMIAYAPALENPPAIIGGHGSGASETASELCGRIEDFFVHYSRPRLSLLVPEILSLVRSTAGNPNSSEASPVSEDTAREAVKFAILLPKSLPIPEISSDPDGEISFDWIGKTGAMFSVSVDTTGRLAYAGRFGEKSKVHGIEQLSESCPQEILRGIQRAAG